MNYLRQILNILQVFEVSEYKSCFVLMYEIYPIENCSKSIKTLRYVLLWLNMRILQKIKKIAKIYQKLPFWHLVKDTKIFIWHNPAIGIISIVHQIFCILFDENQSKIFWVNVENVKFNVFHPVTLTFGPKKRITHNSMPLYVTCKRS